MWVPAADVGKDKRGYPRLSEEATSVGQGVLTLTDQTFDEQIKGVDEPVLVDFWAEWCGPCKVIAPILEEIAQEQEGRLSVAKLNVDDSLEVARRYDVMSIPTLLVFKDGQPQARLVGAKPKAQLLQELAAFL